MKRTSKKKVKDDWDDEEYEDLEAEEELEDPGTGKKKKKKKKFGVISIILIVVCVIILVIAAYKILSVYVDYHESTEAVNSVKADAFATDDDDDYDAFDFDALLAQNSEALGWIRMKGDAVENGDVDILIDYPIVQTTDNEYYLERGIDGSYSAYGTLFVDYRCPDGLESSNAVIWGHNMTYPDDAMFGYINKYEDEEGFVEKYPYYDVWIGSEHYIYKVFAYGVVDVDGFFFQYSFADDDAFMDWLGDCFDNLTIYDAELSDFDADSKIITMCACLYPSDDQYRFAVLMYRLDDDEE